MTTGKADPAAEVRAALTQLPTADVRGFDDPGYDQERASFNRLVDHRPDLVVLARHTGDVRQAVALAARRGLPVTPHATGHGPLRAMPNGLMVATRRMSALRVDPRRRLARVQAGVRWEAVVRAAAPHGLAPLNGSSPLVGVVGYTLGGGLGPLGRKFGYAADHVRQLEIVTADGASQWIDHHRSSDLFHGVLGSKGSLGVVTAMEFELAPVRGLYGGGLWFDLSAAEAVLRGWRDWTVDQPDEMTSSIALLRSDRTPVVHLRVAFLGDEDEGARRVAPLRRLGALARDSVCAMPYAEIARVHEDPTTPTGYHEQNTLLAELDDEAVGQIVAHAGPGSPCRDPMVEIRHLGGALRRHRPTLVCGDDAEYCLTTVSHSLDPGTGRDLFRALAPQSTGGSYINFWSGPGADARDAYSPAARQRLSDLATSYDPTGLFRLQHPMVQEAELDERNEPS